LILFKSHPACEIEFTHEMMLKAFLLSHLQI